MDRNYVSNFCRSDAHKRRVVKKSLGILLVLLLLAGCSSSPSIEAQTKLVEYEKCLSHATDVSNLVISTLGRENPFVGSVTNYTYLQKSFEALLTSCESFRP